MSIAASESMNQCAQHSVATPQFSVIIPVYDDWTELEGCLESLAGQENAPSFDAIVVDDGSEEAAPEGIRGAGYPFSFMFVRQAHSGIPSARNLGIRNSKGSILLFVDADCRLAANCLHALNAAIVRSPEHAYFQLRLSGDRSTLPGRAEELRLSTFQQLMSQPDGRIRFLNTAGFAIRRSWVNGDEVFHPGALRGEDTLLLATLIQAGNLPLFVRDAVVEHSISLPLMECLRKDIRTVYLEVPAQEMITTLGVKIRVGHPERVRLLKTMWAAAGEDSIGRAAWFVVVLRQALQRMVSFAYRSLRLGPPGIKQEV